MIYHSISDHAVVGADGERPHHRSEPASKMELRRLQHWAGSRRGQRSHPLVWSSSPCFYYYFLKIKTCMAPCSLLLMWLWLRLFFPLWSPQAIFKDPFRKGDNILVSLCVPSRFTSLRIHKNGQKVFFKKIKTMRKEKRDQKAILTLGLYDFVFYVCFFYYLLWDFFKKRRMIKNCLS